MDRKKLICLMTIVVLSTQGSAVAASTNDKPAFSFDDIEMRTATTVEEYREYKALMEERIRTGGKPIGIRLAPGLEQKLVEAGEMLSPSARRARAMHMLNFQDAPLDQFLGYYGTLTGKEVETDPGVFTTMTLKSERRLSTADAIALCEGALDAKNLAVVPVTTNRVKIIWKQRTKATEQGGGLLR